MTDLVERLRVGADCWMHSKATERRFLPTPEMLLEAAAEIERLRADAALVRAQAMKDAAEEVLNASTKPWGYVETSGDLREALAAAIRALAATKTEGGS